MPDPDAYRPPVVSPSRLEAPDPPITGATRYTERKTIGIDMISSVEDVARAPVTVTVDGDKILNGTQRAEALALLGISEEVLDEAWRYFATEVNWPVIHRPGWGGPQQHQEGMGWQVDVDVVQDRTAGITGLAEIDPRSAHRWVTYRATKWYFTDADIAAGLSGPPSGSSVETKRERLDASGAIGASWRRVEESEMDSTAATEEALLAARMELGNALKEIQVAIKVADAAWQGPRSEATKFKFGTEYEVISAAWDSVESWRRYTHELVGQQREAKEHSDALERELILEGVLLFFPGLAGMAMKMVFSAGRAAKAAFAGSRVVSYAEAIGRITGPLRARYGAVAGQIARSGIALHSTRILARGAGGLASTVAINKAGGRTTTTEDWLMAFGLAAGGYLASEGVGKLLAKVETTHKVDFNDEVVRSVTDGGTQAGFKALTDQAFAASFASGLVSDAVRSGGERRVKRFFTEVLENDPASAAMKRARARFDAERRAADPEGRIHSDLSDLATLNEYIAQEIKETVDRHSGTLLDFTYGVSTQAAESAHQAITSPPPPADLPDVPSGTVARPVGK